MVQPRAQRASPEGNEADLVVRFRFNVETLPAGPCHLVMEEPEKYAVELNGEALEVDQDEGWWIDPSLKRIRVAPGLFRRGENEVVLRTRYGPGSGLEALYLTGEFGVRWEGRRATVTELPTSLGLGDWTGLGFPCYSGAVTYTGDIRARKGEGERVFLELPNWAGVLVKVRLNGKAVGRLAWPPYEVDVTQTLKEGRNRLEIEIVSSRRNLLGPLHLAQKYPPWTGPGQFETQGDEWTDDYVAVPYGLLAPPILSYRKPSE